MKKLKSPTCDEINALPENLRHFVMELETFANPSGIFRENMRLLYDNQALQVVICKLKNKLQKDKINA